MSTTKGCKFVDEFQHFEDEFDPLSLEGFKDVEPVLGEMSERRPQYALYKRFY